MLTQRQNSAYTHNAYTHNVTPAPAYVVQGTTRRGGTVYLTGKAGNGWVSGLAVNAFAYPNAALANVRAMQQNHYVGMHGITFSVVALHRPFALAPVGSPAPAPKGPYTGPRVRLVQPRKPRSPSPHAHKLFATFVIGGLRYVQAGQLTVCFCISRKRPALFGPMQAGPIGWDDISAYTVQMALGGFTAALGAMALGHALLG